MVPPQIHTVYYSMSTNGEPFGTSYFTPNQCAAVEVVGNLSAECQVGGGADLSCLFSSALKIITLRHAKGETRKSQVSLGVVFESQSSFEGAILYCTVQ